MGQVKRMCEMEIVYPPGRPFARGVLTVLGSMKTFVAEKEKALEAGDIAWIDYLSQINRWISALEALDPVKQLKGEVKDGSGKQKVLQSGHEESEQNDPKGKEDDPPGRKTVEWEA